MQNNILASDKITKLFVKFSIPAIISMTIVGLQNIVDGIFLGNYVGPNAMASINIAAPFMTTVIGGTMIIAIGGISFIGRTLGEGDIKRGQSAFRTSMLVLLALACLVGILGFTFSNQLTAFLGANEVLHEATNSYIRTLALFVPFMAISLILGVMSRLIGKPNLFLQSSMLSLGVNIVLNYILIGKLHLGTTGAAIATGLCFTASGIVLLLPFLKSSSVLNCWHGKISFRDIPSILYNGSSEGISTIANATAAYAFNTAFMKLAGETGISAYTAINYLGMFCNMVIFGISSGIGVIISYNYGAKNFDRVKQTLRTALWVSFIFGSTLSVILFLFGRTLTGMFVGNSPEVQALAAAGSRLYALTFIINGFNIIHSGYFTSIGDAFNSIVVAISRGLIFILIGISILPRFLEINGVWLTVPFAEVITAIIVIYLIWRKKNQGLKLENESC